MGRTALLIIDMQNDMAHADGRAPIIDAAHKAPVMSAILDAFREAKEPVIHVVRSYRADTWDVERFRVPVLPERPRLPASSAPGARRSSTA